MRCWADSQPWKQTAEGGCSQSVLLPWQEAKCSSRLRLSSCPALTTPSTGVTRGTLLLTAGCRSGAWEKKRLSLSQLGALTLQAEARLRWRTRGEAGGRRRGEMEEETHGTCRVLPPMLPLTVILRETTGSRAGLEPASPLSLEIRNCGTVPKLINPAVILG